MKCFLPSASTRYGGSQSGLSALRAIGLPACFGRGALADGAAPVASDATLAGGITTGGGGATNGAELEAISGGGAAAATGVDARTVAATASAAAHMTAAT